jgi:uncharacterized protein (DUF58 family)
VIEPTAAQVLRRLELDVTRRLDGLLHGDHRGLRAGEGLEPGDARLYEPGDDVRRIDWAVTARTGDPHVRPAVADHELTAWIVADLSASLDFGTARCEKRDLVAAAVAAVGFLTSRSGNRVGGVLVGPDGHQVVPARAGGDHLRALVHRVLSSPRSDGGGPTPLGPALHDTGRLAQRRGLVAVVSDWLAPPGWDRPLRALAARHEVLAVEVLDPRELELPDVGVLTVVDPETGQRLEVQTADRALRERYARAAADQRARIRRSVLAAGADHVVLRTDRDWLLDLVRFVERRRRSSGPRGPVTA